MPEKLEKIKFAQKHAIPSSFGSPAIVTAGVNETLNSKLFLKLMKPNQTYMYFPSHYRPFSRLSGLTSLELCYPVLHLLIVILHICIVGIFLFEVCKLLECLRELLDDIVHGHCVICKSITCLQRLDSVSKPESIRGSLSYELVTITKKCQEELTSILVT